MDGEPLTVVDKAYDNPFRSSPERRAQYEYRLALDCILPLLKGWGIRIEGARVLDLGCGSGGLSVALAESGARCWGVDLNKERIDQASQMAIEHNVTVQFLAGNALEMGQFGTPFDLVVLSEVVEHLESLPNVGDLLYWCREHLASEGHIYVSFPPWFSPFAGHQAGWPGIRFIPWFHLLPDGMKRLLVPKQAQVYIEYVQELNHLTIGTFERLVSQADLTIARRELYLSRPEFRFRYGIPAVRSLGLARILGAQEFVTTGSYYLLDRSHPHGQDGSLGTRQSQERAG